MKKAHLYKKLEEDKVQCQNCAHYCVIPSGGKGICGVRKNIDGKLYTLVYGKSCALNIDPIEKKPLYHFLPGTSSLSIATVGCNFRCKNCQNWTISQGPRIWGEIQGEDVGPPKVVNMAVQNDLPSISYTYTEPAIFSEYALDTMKLAKDKGIKNAWVTNGFWSKELFDQISPYLDAAAVDLKGFSDKFYTEVCGAKLQPVLDTLKRLNNKGIWTEVITLIIPTLNDKPKDFEKIAQFVKKELGPETPWHVSRFSGAISWKLQDLPDTPLDSLRKAYKIGKKQGLKYVYIGNVAGLDSEDTFCPNCGAKVIDRTGYRTERFDKEGQCPKCSQSLDLIL